MTQHKPNGAEKRVLWEVRQRYQMDRPPQATQKAVRKSVPIFAGGGPPVPPRGGKRSFSSGSKRSGRHWGRRLVLFLILIVALSGGVFGYKIIAASNKITTTDRSILGQLKDLFFTQGNSLGGEKEDRINFLLIAVGGEGHSGQNLADTIMLLSLRPSDNTVGLMSIPRDLYVQVPDEDYYTKINTVHAYGESKKKGGGPELLEKKVEEITGQPIHYFARIDFIAFKQIVDAVGGITITIDNSFFDFWHKISFSAGTETMNGERALAFVRARYIEGPEGGDFKRAARQQQALLALREKIFSVNTAFDFTKANAILNSLSDNIRTDMELWEMKRFYEIARQVDREKVNTVVLTTGPKGVLTGSTEVLGGTPASILKPRTGNYSEIQSMATDIFSHGDDAHVQASIAPAAAPENSPTPSPTPAAITVEVRNGTNITGLAKAVGDTLTEEGYTVAAIGNAAVRTNEKTIVYAQAQDDESQAKRVADFLAAPADVDLPEGEAKSTADVVVILGADAQD